MAANLKYGPRFKCMEHRVFVRSQRCLACGDWPSDDHHPLLTEARRKLGKSHDWQVVPLCRPHHMEIHDRLGEQKFVDKYNIDFEEAWTKLCAMSPSKKVREK